ncbi:MAG TPA: hypothetical protein VJ276_20780 [Thermoanaerobaculia bacterium]|nr:hypothetical protein [Thermoanaerobaculia bacterium]
MTADRFAIAARDELWAHGVLLESRLEHGTAVLSDDVIEATDAYDPDLAAACDEEMARLRAAVASVEDARIRAVARAASDGERSATLTITMRGVSIVTTPAAAARDTAMLRALVGREAEEELCETLPIVWRNGSAAVLLHEAFGHPAEHGIPLTPALSPRGGERVLEERVRGGPTWLRVEDISPRGTADLLAGHRPHALRRASFRDVPLHRMTALVARQVDAPFDAPERHVEVHLVAGGTYDPLTDVVTIDVSIANLGGARLAPFTITTTRDRIAFLGASGEPVRYPGVVCSREGQELVVGSFAPVMITGAM